MAFARGIRRGERLPSSTRMLLYGLEAAHDLNCTLRDLRRTNTLAQSGLSTLFPDETDGLQFSMAP